jgi:hypothetical protein
VTTLLRIMPLADDHYRCQRGRREWFLQRDKYRNGGERGMQDVGST